MEGCDCFVCCDRQDGEPCNVAEVRTPPTKLPPLEMEMYHVGMEVCTWWPQDGVWFAGRIIEVLEEPLVRVRYFDDGEEIIEDTSSACFMVVY